MTEKQARILRIVAIVIMGLTAAMNLLGGIGTVCAAFLTEDFPPMRDFLDYQWLYQRLMIGTIIIGLVGIWATFTLFRGNQNAYRNAIAILVIGTVVGELQVRASLEFRGKAVPANMKFYSNLFTLILFLILRLPSIHERLDFSKPGDKTDMKAAGGLTAMLMGLVILTVGIWVGSSHTFEGANWVDAAQPHLNFVGALLTLGGLVTLVKAVLEMLRLPEHVVLAGANSEQV